MSKANRIDPVELASNPRATLASWQQYRDLVENAFAAHPKAYIYTPTSHAPATVSSRVRDAIKGALCFGYPTSLEPTAFLRWFHEIKIRHTPTEVIFGTRETIRESLQGETAPSAPSLVFDSLTDGEFNAFALLICTQRIEGPVMARTSTPYQRNHAGFVNVEVLHRPDGAVVLL